MISSIFKNDSHKRAIYSEKELIDARKQYINDKEFLEEKLQKLFQNFIKNNIKSKLISEYEVSFEQDYDKKFIFSIGINLNLKKFNSSFSYYCRFNVNDDNFEFSESKVSKSKYQELRSFTNNLSLQDLSEYAKNISDFENDMKNIKTSIFFQFIKDYYIVWNKLNQITKFLYNYRYYLELAKEKKSIEKIFEIYPIMNEINRINNEKELLLFINENLKQNNEESLLSNYFGTFIITRGNIVPKKVFISVDFDNNQNSDLSKAVFYVNHIAMNIKQFINKLNQLITYKNNKIIFPDCIEKYNIGKPIRAYRIQNVFEDTFEKYELEKIKNKVNSF